MIVGLGTGTGGNFGDYKKQQDFTFTSPAAGFGRGDRSDPNKYSATWTPAPNNYTVAKDGS